MLYDYSTEALVKSILKDKNRVWKVMDFGMLKTTLDDHVRLHVWSKALQTGEPDGIHTHPWDFTSRTICGTMYNTVYKPIPYSVAKKHQLQRVHITCGYEACTPEYTGEYHEFGGFTYAIPEWSSYGLRSDETHSTSFEDGTVTIITRTSIPELNEADVYIKGDTWVSARPREATKEEIEEGVIAALRRL